MIIFGKDCPFSLILMLNYSAFRLLTPPTTPLFPSLEMELQKNKMSQMGMPNARPTALKTRVKTFAVLLVVFVPCQLVLSACPSVALPL